jgi:nifR3 family TIM-barrel protein
MSIALTQKLQPTFHVRDIPVYGDLILAPMAGFSDLPYRLICREYGSAMSYTEFVSVHGLMVENPHCVRMLDFHPSERPMTFQIFGRDEDQIIAVAKKVEQLGPSIIDLNMGCSVNKVAGHGCGAALLRDPLKIGRIFNMLSKTLSVPVTGKIRLGWDDKSRNHVEVAKILEDNGASMIAVHGRTRAQAYSGAANWDAIAEVKQAVKIPVIGNGDVKCIADIDRIKRHTGCDAVMIGRAAIGNPWIFMRKDRHEVTFAEKVAMIRRHLELMLDYYGEYGLVLFRKHVTKYITEVRGAAEMRGGLLTCNTAEDFAGLLAECEERVGDLQATGNERRQPATTDLEKEAAAGPLFAATDYQAVESLFDRLPASAVDSR